MSTPSPSVAAAIESSPASARAIVEDILCVKCGYNLRGLKPEHKCPECGLRIRSSLPTRGLVTIADWRAIRTGVLVILGANVALTATPFVALVLSWSASWGVRDVLLGAAPLLMAVLLVVQCVGYSILSRAGERFEYDAGEWRAHSAVRRMAIWRAGLSAVALPLVILSLRGSGSGIGEMLTAPIVVLGFAYALAMLLHFCCVIGFLHEISARSRVPSLMRSVTPHATVCFLGVAPGVLVYGLGLAASWLSYHILLARFALAAQTFVSADQAHEG